MANGFTTCPASYVILGKLHCPIFNWKRGWSTFQVLINWLPFMEVHHGYEKVCKLFLFTVKRRKDLENCPSVSRLYRSFCASLGKLNGDLLKAFWNRSWNMVHNLLRLTLWQNLNASLIWHLPLNWFQTHKNASVKYLRWHLIGLEYDTTLYKIFVLLKNFNHCFSSKARFTLH